MSQSIQLNLFQWRPLERAKRPTHMDLFYDIQRMDAGPLGCFARVKWFADKFNVCARTIKGWLRRLRDQGLLKVEHHGPRGAVMKALAAVVAPIVAPIRKLSYYIKSSTVKGSVRAEKKPPTQEELGEEARLQAITDRVRQEIIDRFPAKARMFGWVA